jgi:hypothetical protein
MLILMEIFSFILRLMDGWSRLSMKLKKLSMRTDAHTGRTHHQFHQMHAIIYVEQFNVTSKGDLEVIAILENEGNRKGLSYIDTPPEVAPIRATAFIRKSALPPGRTFKGATQQQLVRLIEDYKLFLNQEWKPAPVELESDRGDKPNKGGRLFF